MSIPWRSVLVVGIALALGISACGVANESAGKSTDVQQQQDPIAEARALMDDKTAGKSTDAQQQQDPIAEARALMDDKTASGATFKGAVEVADMSTVVVTAGDVRSTYEVFFEPSILIGEPGQTVTVTVRNEGVIAHTFTIPEQDIDEMILRDEEREVEVTFPADGQPLLFICRPHDTGGMVGALVASTE